MSHDSRQNGTRRDQVEPRRASRPAQLVQGTHEAGGPGPGKVTPASRLSPGRASAVQRKAAPAAGAAASQARSLWDLAMDPWADAAFRGATALGESGQGTAQATGPVQLQEDPELLPGEVLSPFGPGGDFDDDLGALHRIDDAPVEEPAAPLLGAAQVLDAIRYHKLQPKKYTETVVGEIRAKLGLGTGGIDEAMVQAIARFQNRINSERTPSPPLAVDGKCGPRTLPILIPVGLATEEEIDAYTQAIEKVVPELEKETDLEKRARTILAEVNLRLASAGVPAIDNLEMDDALNAFTASSWTMTMSRKALADPKGAAATIYHEARHAEQAFRIARMIAGRTPKPSIEQIKREAGINEDAIVEAAAARPIDPGTVEAVQAEGWHENEPGRPSNAQLDARMRLTAQRFQRAAKAYKANPTPANRAEAAAAYKDFKAAQVDAYRNRPDEYDAFFVGEKVDDALGVDRSGGFPELDDAIEMVANSED